MDMLIRNQFLKKNKIVIDIGHKKTKVLGVKYSGGNINITGTYIFDSSAFFQNSEELTDIKGFVAMIDDLVNKQQYIQKGDILISFPSGMFDYRIIKLENVRDKDIKKRMEIENANWTKYNTNSHIIGWSLLGKRSINSEIVQYVIQTAVKKNIANAFSKEFENKGMKLTGITTSVDSTINFSQLYINDFEHSTKLLIDVGINHTQFILLNQDCIIDIRDIEFGFNSFIGELLMKCNIGIDMIIKLLNGESGIYELDDDEREKFIEVRNRLIMYFSDELRRTYDKCDAENVTITKIIVIGDYIKGIFDNLEDIVIENPYFEEGEEYECENFNMVFDKTVYTPPQFCAALGTAIHTMLVHKNNLISDEYADKHFRRYIKCGFLGICALLGMWTVFTVGGGAVSDLSIVMLEKRSVEYSQKKEEISALEKSIDDNTKKLQEYRLDFFPFYEFMNQLDKLKPEYITVISLDTPDRLLNENKTETTQETSEDEEKDGNSGIQVIGEAEIEEKTEEFSDTTPTIKPIKYEQDLKGRSVILRGKGYNESDVVSYIYDISNIDCVRSLELNAIEEREENGTKIKVFEIIINLE